MTPHLSEEQFALYRNRSLRAAELLSVSHHLAQCDACQARITSASELYAGVEAFHAVLDTEAASPSHLTYDEIAAYVDKQLASEDAARVEEHAQECAACADEVSQIELLKRELEATRKPRWLDAVSSVWRERLVWKGAFALAGAAACALLILLVVRKPMPQAPIQQATAAVQRPRLAAEIHDGKRLIAIAPGGKVTGLEYVPESLRASVAQAITTQKIEVPSVLTDLTGKRSVLLGADTTHAEVELLGPLGIVVETQDPILQWTPMSGAEYNVSVYSDGYEEVAASGWIRETRWQVSKALRRGARYSWQISVRHDGAEFTVPKPPAPEARFRILGAAEEAELAQLKAGGADVHLVLGIGYARMGALDEADRELRQAHEQNPDSSAVAAVLASVERMRTPKP